MIKYNLIIIIALWACSRDREIKPIVMTIPTVTIEVVSKDILLRQQIEAAEDACLKNDGTVILSPNRLKSSCFEKKISPQGFGYEGPCIWDMAVSCISDEEGTECYWIRSTCGTLIKP